MVAAVQEIWRRRDLLWMLIARNLKIRYKDSALGFFWSLLGPLLLIVIYSLFLNVIRFNIDLRVLVTGIIVWQFLGMCLGDSLHAILGNANLVTKAAFPRMILPLAMVKANLVNFLLSFVVVLIYLRLTHAAFGAVYWLPLIILSQTALCVGVAMIFSALNVFFRDTEHILSVLMLAWFFLTPVIYPIEKVLGNPHFPPWVTVAFFCNPMTGLVTAYRMVLLSVPSPGAGLVEVSFVVAWTVCAVGLVVFRKTEVYFGDAL